jgi:hypothetical protein
MSTSLGPAPIQSGKGRQSRRRRWLPAVFVAVALLLVGSLTTGFLTPSPSTRRSTTACGGSQCCHGIPQPSTLRCPAGTTFRLVGSLSAASRLWPTSGSASSCRGGDLDRSERHRAVVLAILTRGLSRDTIRNPRRFIAFTSGVAGHVIVDEDLTPEVLRGTALSLRLTLLRSPRCRLPWPDSAGPAMGRASMSSTRLR